jgi:hypothetical protein
MSPYDDTHKMNCLFVFLLPRILNRMFAVKQKTSRWSGRSTRIDLLRKVISAFGMPMGNLGFMRACLRGLRISMLPMLSWR